MIKKGKMKTSTLKKNPYVYYMTNWGFIRETPETSVPNTKKKK